jgi:hypothetical protein
LIFRGAGSGLRLSESLVEEGGFIFEVDIWGVVFKGGFFIEKFFEFLNGLSVKAFFLEFDGFGVGAVKIWCFFFAEWKTYSIVERLIGLFLGEENDFWVDPGILWLFEGVSMVVDLPCEVLDDFLLWVSF